MHVCPHCGMECDCSGDWDDISVMSDAWVMKNCKHECEDYNEDEWLSEDDFEDDWMDDDEDWQDGEDDQ
jgi:hypothetical protein